METLMALFLTPLMLLNMLGGIVSGIWLAIIGAWWAIGLGVAGMVFSHFLLALIMTPGILIFDAPAAMLADNGKVLLALPLIILGRLYTTTWITVWCLFVFFFFMHRATHTSVWPLILWSYGVALGPLMYMASMEAEDNIATNITTFFAQIAFIVMAIVAFVRGGTFFELALVFGCIMLIAVIIQVSLGLKMARVSGTM